MLRTGIRMLALALALGIALQGAMTLHAQAAEDTRKQEPAISVIVDPGAGAPARHGIKKIVDALKQRGVAVEDCASPAAALGKTLIIAGTAKSGGEAVKQLGAVGAMAPEAAEALVIQHAEVGGKPALILCGADDRGLMYAALDVADRIAWAADPQAPLSEVRDAREQPDVRERAISIYTMQRAAFEQRFYDERYWDRYFDMLARDRYNSFVLIFGYENGGFLAPPYPYFFDTPGFPGVKMVGLTPQQQAKNLAALNRLIRQAHARGIAVTLGIWDHIYRAGVQTGGVKAEWAKGDKPTPGLVWGVTTENLNAYTRAALERLLREAPEMDGLEFRMHGESGLKKSEMADFWHKVFELIKARQPDLRFDARAKELPDSIIDDGLAMGIRLRVSTKYWMEQMGLPFHPTHVNTQNQKDRRHGYADLLNYPRRYPMVWQLWSGGTSRVLLWGDPDYARRFAASTHLFDGDGYEVNEPLATKMEAQLHDERPFELLAQAYRGYDYEFERYWHFFQVFGRLGYNPATPDEVWLNEFKRRFGGEAGPAVAAGLHRASGVLPRIVASVYPYGSFPTTRGWAERQRLGDLPAYAKNQGSDIQLFENFEDEAKRLIEGGETAMVRPQQTSRWFERAAADIEKRAAAAAAGIGARRGAEFSATLVDLNILAALARFHARRIPAAISYNLFQRLQDPAALDDAIAGERRAVEAWRSLVAAAGDAYAPDLMMGVRSADLCGHWRDELKALEAGLAKLERERAGFKPKPAQDGRKTAYAALRSAVWDEPAGAEGEAPVVKHTPLLSAPLDKAIRISAEVSASVGVKWVRLRYRGVTQFDDYKTLEMKRIGDTQRYEAVVPADQIDPKWDFMYFIEALDNRGNGTMHPDFSREAPYIVVKLKR